MIAFVRHVRDVDFRDGECDALTLRHGGVAGVPGGEVCHVRAVVNVVVALTG